MLAAASPPVPTPAATLASIYNPVLRPRAITDVYNGIDINCYNINALSSCASILTGCNKAAPRALDKKEANSCLCDSGLPYLNCLSSVWDGAKCLGYELGTADWGEYQLSYFEETCGGAPATAMAQITAPASVALTFESVKVVTVTETDSIEKPKEVPQPNYKGSGALLSGDCKKTAFTLVDAGSTAYWAGFNGCQGDKPECCPYTVATPTATPTVNTRGPDRNSGNALGFDFPRPADDGRQTMLKKCADDYYSISGGCCPNGYWLYTTNVGGQTPCYKSISSTATPPALTIGLEDEASDIFKPTSAVVNIVWSMRYPVESSSSGLSTGAKAGIGAGAGVAIILIAVLAICLWRSRRKTRQLESAHAAQSAQVPPPQYQEQQPTVINGEHPSNHFGASVGMSSSSPLTPQGTGVSATSSQKPPGYFNGAPIPGMPYGAVSPIVVANGIAYASPTAEAQDGQGFGQYQPPPPQYPGDNTPQQQPQPQVQLYSPPGQSYSSPQPQQYSPLPSQQQGLPQGQYYFLPQQPQSPQLGYPLQGYQQPAQGFQPQQAPHNGDMTRNVPMTEMSPQRRGDVS